MFKNKTEQNRNDEKNYQTGLTVKIHSNHDGIAANMFTLWQIILEKLIPGLKLPSKMNNPTYS